ncbi:MAG TPA: flagellar protein FlaG [Novimethylophilus sp.]|jgi:flagellar protein FlaG|uniref:flagellar protein FlaG n=1 Tax=Novimethylophilus sp. TaxID=2137426 RepID=UPI002F428CD3
MQVSLRDSVGHVPSQSHSSDAGSQRRIVSTEVANASAANVELLSQAVQPVGNTVDVSVLKNMVDDLNHAVKIISSNLEFSVDEDTDISVIKVVDSDSNEVIRQIPSKEVIAIAKALDQLKGLLVKDKV